MKLFATLTALAMIAAPVQAQQGVVREPPKTWISVFGGGFLEPGGLDDPTTNTHWDVGTSVMFGAGIHRQLGQGLQIGLEGSFAPSADYEFRDIDSEVVLQQSTGGQLASALASGRLNYGGGGTLGIYLTGGIGMFFWSVPDVLTSTKHWDGDLGLLTGAGLEYRFGQRSGLFLEWGRNWVFHQKEGVKDNSVKFTGLRGGLRFGT